MTDTFQDALTLPGTAGLPPRFFDRFVFNLHPEARAPSVIVGLGLALFAVLVAHAAFIPDRHAAITRTARWSLRHED